MDFFKMATAKKEQDNDLIPLTGIPNSDKEIHGKDLPTLTEKIFAPLTLIKTGMPRVQGEATPTFEDARFDELKSDVKIASLFMFTMPFGTFFFV
jgi:hypothetical protein